jgi:hypothetical protein
VTATVQREPVNTTVPIFRAYLNAGPDKFSFLIPENFRMGGETAPGTLKLTSLTGDTLITLSFLDPAFKEATEIKADACRESLAGRYPAGKFGAEFSRPVLGRKAVCYDVEWKSPAGQAQITRTIYVPTVAGVIELTATAGTKKFRDAENNFNEILASFTAAKDGKLVIHRIAEMN